MESETAKAMQQELARHAGATAQQLQKLKLRLAREHNLGHVPTNIELAAALGPAARKELAHVLTIKPTRISSGVNVIAIMTRPIACPHGRCTYCPGGPGSVFGDVPQSYTGNEPASMRAIRSRYDAYLQVMSRLEQYAAMNKLKGKIELIVMGGTFPSFDRAYQEEFVRDALLAMNDFSAMFFGDEEFDYDAFNEFFEMQGSMRDPARTQRIHERLLGRKRGVPLQQVQEENERARVRCVALCIETKPDWSVRPHIDEMLRQGATRVELGVQSLYDDVLKRTNRGHTVQDSIEATRLLRDSLLKVGYHMMPGQPGSTPAMDEAMLRNLFENPDFRPDALKIYPCLVMPGTPLHIQWQRGEFMPMTTAEAAALISRITPHVPAYCRTMRIQRDIPTKVTAGGVNRTNLRQYVDEERKKSGIACRCIRCREPRWKDVDFGAVKLSRLDYEASGGQEVFLSFDDTKNDFLLGYCRLRIPAQPLRPEITPSSAGIRELHVFGNAAAVGEKGAIQHRGLGTKLVREAERIAKEEFSCDKMLVIAGIGAREYYRAKLGYARDGAYMSVRL